VFGCKRARRHKLITPVVLSLDEGTTGATATGRRVLAASWAEGERRGVYAGAIGYLSFTGSLDTCIAIRTMVVKDGVATVQAAAGIVADSTAPEEYLETQNKSAVLLQALEAVR